MQDGAATGGYRHVQVALQNHCLMPNLAAGADHAVQHAARPRRQRPEAPRRPHMKKLALHHRAVKRRRPLGRAQNSNQFSPERSGIGSRLPLTRQPARHLIVEIDRRDGLEIR